MTFEELNNLIEKHNIPKNVRLMSDSGWECGATDMDGVYYFKDINTIIFTQGSKYDDYLDSDATVLFNKEVK